jgi:uncharacterized protein (DUF1015 family)
MRLFAFQGTHYDFANPDAGSLAAPPYDQINDDATRDRFHALSPHHFTHLSRPLPGEEGDLYLHAAAVHRSWIEAGVLVRDEEPALYPYVIELQTGERRLGICGLVGLEPPESAAIRPHEHTLAKPLADRLSLLRAMRVDLEPVLLTSDDHGELDALLTADTQGAPLLAHSDEGGCRHLLYRVSDGERIRKYQDLLGRVDGAIADGHHRYKVAGRLAEEIGAEPGTAAAAKLAVITSLRSPALAIDPIHRGLRQEPDLAAVAELVVRRQAWEGTSGSALAEAVASAPQPALGVATAGGVREVWTLDPATAPDSLAPGARELSVALLHEAVFTRWGLPAEAATDGTVLYRSDPRELLRMVEAGKAGAGFFLPPMEPPAFAAAIAHGDMLPPKSTRFLPKVVSGLVWGDHGSRLR